VILRGGMGAKARAAALAQLDVQPGGKPLLVVATGPYVGEGFDCPTRDMLFLAAPIAQKGRLELGCRRRGAATNLVAETDNPIGIELGLHHVQGVGFRATRRGHFQPMFSRRGCRIGILQRTARRPARRASVGARRSVTGQTETASAPDARAGYCAQNGTSGALANGKHARRWATLPLLRTVVIC
jgi:hypothetical protein